MLLFLAWDDYCLCAKFSPSAQQLEWLLVFFHPCPAGILQHHPWDGMSVFTTQA